MARFAGLILASGLMLLGVSASAEVLAPGSIGCTQKAIFSRLMRLAATSDRAAMQGLINNGMCMIVPATADVEVIDSAATDSWKIVVSYSGTVHEIWISPLSIIAE